MDINDFEKYAQAMQDELEANSNRVVFEKMKAHQGHRLALQKAQQDWLRFLVATSGTLFSVLVALGDKTTMPIHARPLYGLAVSLLGLSVLFLAIALYEPMYHQKKDFLHRLSVLKKSDADTPESSLPVMYNTPIYFGLAEKTAYIFLVLSVGFLVAFSLVVFVF